MNNKIYNFICAWPSEKKKKDKRFHDKVLRNQTLVVVWMTRDLYKGSLQLQLDIRLQLIYFTFAT